MEEEAAGAEERKSWDGNRITEASKRRFWSTRQITPKTRRWAESFIYRPEVKNNMREKNENSGEMKDLRSWYDVSLVTPRKIKREPLHFFEDTSDAYLFVLLWVFWIR